MKKEKIILIISLIVMSFSGIVSVFAVNNYLYDSNEVSYNNTSSGLSSTDVQGAIDELHGQSTDYSGLNSRVSTLESYFNDNTSEINIVGNPVKINGKDVSAIGTIYSKNGTSTSVASGTSKYTSIGNFELPSAGTWVINIKYVFGGNATGYRLGHVFTNSGVSTAADNTAFTYIRPFSGANNVSGSTFYLQPTAKTTYYVGVKQNAGAAIGCYFRVVAVRII